MALWLASDYGLYGMAREAVRACRNLDLAAEQIKDTLTVTGIHETPDGAKYSITAIRAALSKDM